MRVFETIPSRGSIAAILIVLASTAATPMTAARTAVQPLCLTCHGDNLAPDLASRIADLYPNDQATGFAEGDFRGVFWVEYPASE